MRKITSYLLMSLLVTLLTTNCMRSGVGLHNGDPDEANTQDQCLPENDQTDDHFEETTEEVGTLAEEYEKTLPVLIKRFKEKFPTAIMEAGKRANEVSIQTLFRAIIKPLFCKDDMFTVLVTLGKCDYVSNSLKAVFFTAKAASPTKTHKLLQTLIDSIATAAEGIRRDSLESFNEILASFSGILAQGIERLEKLHELMGKEEAGEQETDDEITNSLQQLKRLLGITQE